MANKLVDPKTKYLQNLSSFLVDSNGAILGLFEITVELKVIKCLYIRAVEQQKVFSWHQQFSYFAFNMNFPSDGAILLHLEECCLCLISLFLSDYF